MLRGTNYYKRCFWLLRFKSFIFSVCVASVLHAGVSEEIIPDFQITISELPESMLDWGHLEALLEKLSEIGCIDGQINGFYWNSYPCLRQEDLPSYEDLDELVLQCRGKNSSTNSYGVAQKQYDLKSVHDWGERNRARHALLICGRKAPFSAIREIANILKDYGIIYHLNVPSYDDASIRMKLYGKKEKKK